MHYPKFWIFKSRYPEIIKLEYGTIIEGIIVNSRLYPKYS